MPPLMDSFAGKRLVIFGCGYLGTAVAQRALKAGMHVVALTRNRETAGHLAGLGVEPLVADLAEEGWHSHLAAQPDFVLNCVSSGGGGVDAYRRSYVAGMRSIVAWARKSGSVGTLVYTGSTSVYPQDGGVIVDETAPTGGEAERPQLLREAEALVSETPGAWQRWFILRLAGIYGPERSFLLEQIRRGEVAGNGDHHLNLIHRDDAVAAVLACFAAPSTVGSQVFNVADNGAAPKREVVSWVAQAVGLPNPVFSGEPAAGRRVITPDRIISNKKCQDVLGWRPGYPTFREGYGSLLSR